MKISIKLLSLMLILAVTSPSLFSMDDMTEEEQLALAISMSLGEQNSTRSIQASSASSSSSSSMSSNKKLEPEAKVDSEEKTVREVKEEWETSAQKLFKMNAYRSKCLEEHMPKVLSDLVQQYDPIKDSWIDWIDWQDEPKLQVSGVTAICSLQKNQLVFGTLLGQIKIWNYVSGKLETILEDKIVSLSPELHLELSPEFFALFDIGGFINALCILPENKLAYGRFREIKIWNLNSGKLEKKFEGHTSIINSLCVLPVDKLISSSLGETKIWDLHSGQCEKTLNISADVLCPLYGNKFLSGHTDGTIKIWDLNNYECENTLEGHNGSCIKALSVLPRNRLLSIYACGAVKIWDLSTKKCLQTSQGNVTIELCCILPFNKLAATTSFSNRIKIWSNRAYLPVPDEILMNLVNKYKVALDRYNLMDRETAFSESKKIIEDLFYSIEEILRYLKNFSEDKLEAAKNLLFNREVSLETLEPMYKKLQDELKVVNDKIEEAQKSNKALNDALDAYDGK